MSDKHSYSSHQLALKLAVEAYGDQVVEAHNNGALYRLADNFYHYMFFGRAKS